MNKPYFITYDLNAPGQNYEKIISIIKDEISLSYCSYWKSSFLVKSNFSPDQIMDKIKPYLDSNDRFLVIEVNRNYQGWLNQDQWDFIRRSIF